MNVITLQFSTSLAWQSAVIRRLCHSPFSHVDFILEDGSCLGASGDGGVMIRPPDYQQFGIRRRAVIRTDKAPAILDAAKSQIGKPFDGSALYSFFSTQRDRNWRDTGKWFCSEHTTWSCEIGGLWLYELVVTAGRVTPADLLLLLNPLIDVDKFWQPIDGLKLGPHEI